MPWIEVTSMRRANVAHGVYKYLPEKKQLLNIASIVRVQQVHEKTGEFVDVHAELWVGPVENGSSIYVKETYTEIKDMLRCEGVIEA